MNNYIQNTNGFSRHNLYANSLFLRLRSQARSKLADLKAKESALERRESELDRRRRNVENSLKKVEREKKHVHERKNSVIKHQQELYEERQKAEMRRRQPTVILHIISLYFIRHDSRFLKQHSSSWSLWETQIISFSQHVEVYLWRIILQSTIIVNVFWLSVQRRIAWSNSYFQSSFVLIIIDVVHSYSFWWEN